MPLAQNRRSFLRSTAAATAGIAIIPRPAGAAKLKPAYPISGPVTRAEYAALKKLVAETLKRNEVTISAGTFHVPSQGQYTSLFSWDSGWHAIGMSRIDPKIAASEISALFSLQFESGRVSHDTHFPELDRTRAGFGSKLWNLAGRSQFDDQGRSNLIDPPAFIVACEKIYECGQDRAWLEAMLPKLARCIRYLTVERDLFGAGTPCIIHPWESGTDCSPSYDKVLRINYRTPLALAGHVLVYFDLLNYNSSFSCDPQEAKKRNRFVMEDLVFISITMRACQSVARLYELAGERSRADEFRALARKIMAALDQNNWVESEGYWTHRYDVKNPKLAERSTCASLLPLMTGLPDRERAERVLTRHVLNPGRFWTDYLFPFNPADEMEGDRIFNEDLLLWRGHCIWTNMNWMMVEALQNYGRNEEARELTRRTVKMILHEGMREFYDPRSGQGKGARNFNWPAVALDMVHATWPEAVA